MIFFMPGVFAFDDEHFLKPQIPVKNFDVIHKENIIKKHEILNLYNESHI